VSAPLDDPNWLAPDGKHLYDYANNTWYLKGATRGGTTWSKTSAPAGVTPPAQHWSSGDAHHPADTPVPTGGGPTPPKVPGGDGTGNTSVDTPSLDRFVENVKSLVTPVNNLVTLLKTTAPVQPGAFYHADAIRANINGDNGDGGLKAKYRSAVTDLGSGLTDLHEAIAGLSAKYKSTEEANKGTADDVSRALNGASSYFGGIVTDTGGGGPPAGCAAPRPGPVRVRAGRRRRAPIRDAPRPRAARDPAAGHAPEGQGTDPWSRRRRGRRRHTSTHPIPAAGRPAAGPCEDGRA
jgi:hypothetical protein